VCAHMDGKRRCEVDWLRILFGSTGLSEYVVGAGCVRSAGKVEWRCPAYWVGMGPEENSEKFGAIRLPLEQLTHLTRANVSVYLTVINRNRNRQSPTANCQLSIVTCAKSPIVWAVFVRHRLSVNFGPRGHKTRGTGVFFFAAYSVRSRQLVQLS
jgi:hypothetical protein